MGVTPSRQKKLENPGHLPRYLFFFSFLFDMAQADPYLWQIPTTPNLRSTQSAKPSYKEHEVSLQYSTPV